MWHMTCFKGICVNEHTRSTTQPSQTIPNQLKLLCSGVIITKYPILSYNILTTFPKWNSRIQQLHKRWSFNTEVHEWELDRMFGTWNSTVWEISNWIQVARNHRSTMILNRFYKAFFHCDGSLVIYQTKIFSHIHTGFRHWVSKGTIPHWWRLWSQQQLWSTTATAQIYPHLCSILSGWSFLWPLRLPGILIPTFSSTQKGRPAKPPLHQMVCRHPNFDDSPPAAFNSDDDEKEDFPQAHLNDSLWSEKPILNRDWCICMSPRTSETTYPSQIPTQPQEPIHESATIEEPMDSMIRDMPSLIDVPREVLSQNYLYKSTCSHPEDLSSSNESFGLQIRIQCIQTDTVHTNLL